ncbi:Selenoprotein SelK/SelG [Trypanosoma melophagium]|uniref:Selenoprotein SelK/SelG n=1 Tax=Trypanosoma melophagium TaxID=715481 RepID=UPI00351A5BC8|nr:Selenoprotein SelK/SelG [Trypanosoma melophagium]
MPYISNGKVLEKKPFSLLDFLLSILYTIKLFFLMLFSSEPARNHTQSHISNMRPGSLAGNSGGRHVRGSNVHTLPKGSLSGGCGSS